MIGKCDNCEEDNRYLIEGYDSFDVHVANVCLYGCSNPKSIFNPFEPMEQIEDEYDPMEAMEEAYNDRPCFMDELEEELESLFEPMEPYEDEYGPTLPYVFESDKEDDYFNEYLAEPDDEINELVKNHLLEIEKDGR
ncbi:hypothetical protein OCO53_25600 [Peribacillus frigoritolerans]|uniref:hypothetical protein n=1 Tax=Peribacillus frigoritolerans TaxID=450367 RepID=UPI0021CEA5D2|nr:hypothetical protein [Peribacillus frigoritolerans]MCU6603819.1 hypothetical protein [Peribacillus frigoritolerans]